MGLDFTRVNRLPFRVLIYREEVTCGQLVCEVSMPLSSSDISQGLDSV